MDQIRLIEETLRKAGFEQVDAYRYNSASIRVRVIDSRFAGKKRMARVEMLEPFIGQLPEEIQRDIIVLLFFSPEELNREVF